jgi:hypothetical protein
MSSSEKPTTWWHTLPGVLAGIAAVTTAVGGLLVILEQTGGSPPPDEGRDISGTWSDRVSTTFHIRRSGEDTFEFDATGNNFESRGEMTLYGSDDFRSNYEGWQLVPRQPIKGTCRGDFANDFSIMKGTCTDAASGYTWSAELLKE